MSQKELVLIYLLVLTIVGHKVTNLSYVKKIATNHACKDFYSYACQDYFTQLPSEDRHKFHYAVDLIAKKVREQKQNFLEGLIDNNDSPKSVMLKNFLISCLDKNLVQTNGFITVQKILEKIKIINSKNEFIEFMSRPNELGEIYPFLMGRMTALENSKKLDLYFLPHKLNLGLHSHYKNAEVIELYKDALILFFKELGWETPKLAAELIADYEVKMASLHLNKVTKDKGITQAPRYKVDDYLKFYPLLGMEHLLSKIRQKNFKISDLYSKQLHVLNEYFESWSLYQLKTFYIFQYLSGFATDLFPKYAQKIWKLSNQHLGYQKQLDRSRKILRKKHKEFIPPEVWRKRACLNSTIQRFGRVLEYYIQDEIPVLNEQAQSDIKKIIQVLKSSAVEMLESSWLSVESKRKLIHKIKNLNFLLYKPQEFKYWNILSLDLDFDPKNYLQNIAKWNDLERKEALKSLGQEFDHKIWTADPFAAAPYYRSWSNTIILPLALFSSPFYNPQQSLAKNLGGIGFQIAHEIAHAIDDNGYLFDEKGLKTNLLTASDEEIMLQRLQNYILYFDQFEKRGEKTLSENICDSIGLKIAQMGLTKLISSNEQSSKEFYLNYARTLCTKYDDFYAQKMHAIYPHSAPHVRVNQQVRLHESFGRAFRCEQQNRNDYQNLKFLYE